MMNSKIRIRERLLTDQNVNTPKGNQANNQLSSRILKNCTVGTKVEKPSSGLAKPRAPQPIKTINLGRVTICQKGFLSPLRNRELQRIQLDNGQYDCLFVEIKEIERGVKVELISEDDHANHCTITMGLETADIDRNKVKHSFPMPRLLVTTKWIRLPVRDFSQKNFTIVVQSIKGKIKQDSVLTQPPEVYQDQQSFIVEVNPLSQVEEAQRIRRRKFEGGQWTLKGSRSATFLRDVFSPRQGKQDPEENKECSMFVAKEEAKEPQTPQLNTTVPCQYTEPFKLKIGKDSATENLKSSEVKTLGRVTSTQMLKNNKSSSHITEVTTQSRIVDSTFKKKDQVRPIKPVTATASTQNHQLTNARSPKQTMEGTKMKYIPTARGHKPQISQLPVGRMLDFSDSHHKSFLHPEETYATERYIN